MQNLVNRKIWVTFQKEGIHAYPAAGTDPKLKDVSFLQYPHRHMFHFKVSISVVHDDRDIEFIQFKRWLISLYDDIDGGVIGINSVLDLHGKSCEMIGENLLRLIDYKYPGRNVEVEVSEDGENGSVITSIFRGPVYD